MAISSALCKALLQEHSYRPFTGQIGFLGRQTTALTEDEAALQLNAYGIPKRVVTGKINLDADTRAAKVLGRTDWLTEKGFFSTFSDAKLTTFDVTDYERCDVVHDFTKPVPSKLFRSYDAVWLGSCLDNISDPFSALKNGADLLKPGGRLIDFEICTTDLGAYLAYPPGFFMDWLAINGFVNARIYIMVFDERSAFQGSWHLYALDSDYPSYRQMNFRSLPFDSLAVCYWIADKAVVDKAIESPVQGQYRDSQIDVFYKKHFRSWFSDSVRPLLVPSRREGVMSRRLRLAVQLSLSTFNRVSTRTGFKITLKQSRVTVPELRGFRYLGIL